MDGQLQYQIKGLLFNQVGRACPERYDVFYVWLDETHRLVPIGGVRLRYGELTAWFKDDRDDVVLRRDYKDKLLGQFESEDERVTMFGLIAECLLTRVKSPTCKSMSRSV